MSITNAGLLFVASLMLMSISSVVLAKAIDRIGKRLRLSEGLLGLFIAVGANSPEISTAVVALAKQSHDLGVGVILGSNIFNIAALLGLSAIISGKILIARKETILNGFVAVAFSAISVAIVLKSISAWLGLTLLLLIFFPYVVILAKAPASSPLKVAHGGSFKDVLILIPGLALTILGSIWMVDSASTIAKHWEVSERILGVLVLASATGIPNVLAAIRLAIQRRGSAVVSETLNSNSLNVLVGLSLPILILGEGQLATLTRMTAWWFLGMTAATVTFLFVRRELRRWEGLALIGVYGVFVYIVLRWQ